MSLLLLLNPGLAGTSSLSFSPAGVLSAQGALVGASSLAFSSTGTAVGAGVLSGASPLALSAVANIVGSGTLVGSIAAAFSTTGAVSATGLLAGQTGMVFAPVGNLEGVSLLGGISGSASFGFALAGSLIDLQWFVRIASPDTADIAAGPVVALETIIHSLKPATAVIIEEIDPPLVDLG